MPLITVRTGTVNLPNKSAKLLVFVSPCCAPSSSEMMLFAAAKVSRFGVNTAGQPVIEQAVSGQAIATHGSVTTQQFSVAEGTILKVFFSSRHNLTRALGSASMPTERHASRYYRVRSGAAVVTLSFPLLNDPRCPHQTGIITGPVEPITLAEAEREGINPVAPQFRRLITDTMWFDSMVSRTVIQEATSRAVQVPAAGNNLQIQAAATALRSLQESEAEGRAMGRQLLQRQSALQTLQALESEGSRVRQQTEAEAREAIRPSEVNGTTAQQSPTPSPAPEAPARIVSLPVRRRILS